MDAADNLMFWAITTPGTPKDRVAYLEASMKKVHEDPGFAAALANAGAKRPPIFIPAARLEEMMKAFGGMSAEHVTELEQVIEMKYVKK